VLEDARGGIEVHLRRRGNFNREPKLIEKKDSEEDCDRKTEVVLQELWIPDIGNQGKVQAYGSKEPGEPAFVENRCARVLDLKSCKKEVSTSVLDTRNNCHPPCPKMSLS
jgi:hypothetical protein